MNPYVLLAFGWAIYFILHSVLASARVKSLVKSRSGFRLFYSLVATAGLLGLMYYNGTIESPNYFENRGAVRYLSLSGTAFGVILIQLAFRQYGFKEFIGLAEEKPEPLKTSGILSSIRHPIYSGLIMITIGYFLFTPNLPTLISCCCILVYLPIGIYIEEKKLIGRFGDSYRNYKDRVPALIPKIKF